MFVLRSSLTTENGEDLSESLMKQDGNGLTDSPQGEKRPENLRQNYARWVSFGIEFCGVMGLFCYAGYKLDERLSTSPWLLLAGFFLGFTGMFYTILKEMWNKKSR